jgi:hypothetical protein
MKRLKVWLMRNCQFDVRWLALLVVGLGSLLAGCGGGGRGSPPPTGGVAKLQEVPGQVPADTIEIQGLSAGSFNSSSWQQDKLNWVPDVRMPMLAPLTTGPFQNIYAPWPLEQATGWRLFYGGWDGSATPNDNVYSVDTNDFLSFGSRGTVIRRLASHDLHRLS